MRLYLLIAFFSLTWLHASAQGSVRQQIDKDRGKGALTEEKSYEKGRSFIRRDSTYYVGYMLEGAYLFFRANDELGFNKASVPLQKALDRIENDFDPLLRMRTNNFNDYSANYKYQFDYGLITYFLDRCYQNVEDQEKAMEVLRHIRDRNFQVEINTDSYNTMAWLYHRNRVFTSKHFSFLKNSVRENVEAANRCLDSAIQKIKNDFPLNNGLYDPNFLNRQFLSTFHYKAMIHDYLLDIDSANYYYDLLIRNGAVSTNNYAEFKLAMGEFEEAEIYFKEAEKQGSMEKSTKEYYYMRGTLAGYRGHPEEADTLLNEVLRNQGSTPGYGWHSIGLARAQHYEGLTAESQDRTNKAARFQELHIGTTWGQEQYNLSVASLNYINQLQFKKEYAFEHNEWYFWLNPINWYRWVKHSLSVRHHKMVLASMVAENPEREQVIYTIFSPENLMSFDEVWAVIDGFGNEYFIDVYEKLLRTDKRPRLQKYFRFFLGKLYLAEGDETKATEYFKQVLRSPDLLEDPFQVMLMARTYEGLALASSGAEREKYIQQLYRLYPQLLPFTDLTMQFQLNAKANSEIENDILDELRNTDIDFTNDQTVPLVNLSFTQQGEALDVNYQVQSSGEVLQQGVFRIESTERANAGKLLAYRLFKIQKNKIGEQPPAVQKLEPVMENSEKPI